MSITSLDPILAGRQKRADARENRRKRQFEASIIQGVKDEKNERIRRQELAGRAALIQTTPQGVLNPSNRGRSRLTV